MFLSEIQWLRLSWLLGRALRPIRVCTHWHGAGIFLSSFFLMASVDIILGRRCRISSHWRKGRIAWRKMRCIGQLSTVEQEAGDPIDALELAVDHVMFF